MAEGVANGCRRRAALMQPKDLYFFEPALTRAAVDVVFGEEASGANTARPVLAKTLATLRSGDTLVVWRLDRLGRSLGQLIEVATVLRERGVFHLAHRALIANRRDVGRRNRRHARGP